MNRNKYKLAAILLATIILVGCIKQNKNTKINKTKETIDASDLKTIYFAGGCFWGIEGYMEKIYGVYDATSGYANGKTENPTYEEVSTGETGHAETVKVQYEPKKISLEKLLSYFLMVVDPTSLNKQGNDEGTQYRSGIYYVDDSDRDIIVEKLKKNSKNMMRKLLLR